MVGHQAACRFSVLENINAVMNDLVVRTTGKHRLDGVKAGCHDTKRVPRWPAGGGMFLLTAPFIEPPRSLRSRLPLKRGRLNAAFWSYSPPLEGETAPKGAEGVAHTFSFVLLRQAL